MMLVLGQALADSAGWGHMSGWGWGWMAFGWLFMLSLVVLVVWFVGRISSPSPGKPDPEEILTDRFARGEMSREEFEERRAALRS